MATDEETVKLGEATIARLEFSMVSATPEERSVVTFNGVPVGEISEEKAHEMFPDLIMVCFNMVWNTLTVSPLARKTICSTIFM